MVRSAACVSNTQGNIARSDSPGCCADLVGGAHPGTAGWDGFSEETLGRLGEFLNDRDRGRDISSDKVGACGQVFFSVACFHKDRSATCFASAKNIDILISDHPRSREINAVLARGLLEHSSAWFAAVGGIRGGIWAKIDRVDQAIQLS